MILIQVAEDFYHMLQTYHWPGNVRELENALTQTTVRSRVPVLTPDLFQFASSEVSKDTVRAEPEPDLRTLDEVEASHVQRILEYVQGHKGRACEILGISRPSLDRKIRKYELRIR
jgi:transcriptional regulator with PAS, ATPase and Fis domain